MLNVQIITSMNAGVKDGAFQNGQPVLLLKKPRGKFR